MKEKTKNIIVSFGFVIILLIVFFINLITKDEMVSLTERRKLAQIPEITFSKVFYGDIAKKWEEYVVDQFVGRDLLRSIKLFYSTNIAKQKDNNKLFEKDGAIYKIDYPLNENNINKSANRINYVYNKYLKNMNVYYAIIPDKNYYLQNDDHLRMDYNKLKEIMKNSLQEIKYIDIWDSLELSDYYRTDIHWKQEKLSKTVNKIQKDMGLDITQINYTINDVGDFYGAYYGQLATNILPDKMYILTNDTIQNSITYNYETKKQNKVYTIPTSVDKYDLYLCGATPLITIENTKATTEKELLLFRDSFGSSLAPLLIENYNKITLIDLRYISTDLLNQYIDFHNQDVLFLYSTVVLNQNILK